MYLRVKYKPLVISYLFICHISHTDIPVTSFVDDILMHPQSALPLWKIT